jgi:hypothetical protein
MADRKEQSGSDYPYAIALAVMLVTFSEGY